MAFPFRLLLIFLTLPFHAFLGVTIMGQEADRGGLVPLAADDVAARPWTTSTSRRDLWGSGDLVGLTFFAVLFVQWVRSSMREAQRRTAASTGSSSSASGQPSSAPQQADGDR